MRRFLGLAVAVSALMAILSAPWALSQPALNFVFKPLTTVLILLQAWRHGSGRAAERRWVLAGLGLSLAGDVALMWPQQGFLPGLVSFLLAHLAYLVAFTRRCRLAARIVPFVAYAGIAGAILAALWPGVPGPLRAPVVAYVLCLASMAAQAAVIWREHPNRHNLSLAIGGALFMTSDALLAVNRFAQPLPAASLWILATYWLAQWRIAGWLATAKAPRGTGQPDTR